MKKKPLFYLPILIVLSVLFAFSGKEKLPKKHNTAVKQDTIKKSKSEDLAKQNDTVVFAVTKFKSYKKNAHASYYHDKFHGRRTASGIKYDKNKYTAAHKTLPFGTKIKVTNEKNGKSVIVEVTDRGPFVKGRDIDLSRRAFMEITRNQSNGAITATLEIAK